MDQGSTGSYNKARGNNSQMEFNPTEKEAKNDSCPACKGNKVMIHWLRQSLKDLRSEMRMEYNFQKKNIAVQHHEIKDLETKCKHLEEAVEYYKSNNMSSEGKT